MTLFLSDLHLGSRRCQAGKLVEFLKRQDKNQLLILVGDIVDDLGMKSWPLDHTEALSHILDFEDIVYCPGNHDHFVRAVCGLNSRIISVHNEGFYEAHDGRKFFITHGDRYDWSMRFVVGPHWLRAALQWRSDGLHSTLMASTIEQNVLAEAKKRDCAGVICGHTHRPAQKKVDGLEYINCGDWVKNCTAVVDTEHGLRLVYWR